MKDEPILLEPVELYYNFATRFEFFDIYGRDKDGNPIKIDGTIFPFGGIAVQEHSRDLDVWRVHLCSPFPKKGWLPLRHPTLGFLMNKEQAIQFAIQMQP